MKPDPAYHTYRVLSRDRQPLIDFIVEGLRGTGCRLLYIPPANVAPFRFTFETPAGERLGIIAYAFLANRKLTKNRPTDEHRFQVKYGSKGDGKPQPLFDDPYNLYTTLFLGINPNEGFFVAADPWLHNPTKFFISIEFKQDEADTVLSRGWHAWERDRRSGTDEPVEVLVGGTLEHFLRYVYFERAALREDQGHRHWLAENIASVSSFPLVNVDKESSIIRSPNLHTLAQEFDLRETEVLDLIEKAPRLKMAVRGWVAEEHLYRQLRQVRGVTDCAHIEEEGGADVRLRYRGSRPLEIECKNVLRRTTASGLARVDFQRTRASKADPCSRYYRPRDFDIVAACLHSVSSQWQFRYVLPARLDEHPRCPGRLSNNVNIDGRWVNNPREILRLAVAAQ
jgi:hypothetical protein